MAKIFDTEIVDEEKASLKKIREVLEGLGKEEDEHEWIVLSDEDDNNLNYVQATIRFAAEDESLPHPDAPYLVETRIYDEDGEYIHYRTYMKSAEEVVSVFEKYLNDEKIDVSGWDDVTAEIDAEGFLFDEEYQLLSVMYRDDYYPNFLVDKIKEELQKVIELLESGEKDLSVIQAKFDEVTLAINDLEEEFAENDSDLETIAREDIADSVEYILNWFEIPIDVEEAIRERTW